MKIFFLLILFISLQLGCVTTQTRSSPQKLATAFENAYRMHDLDDLKKLCYGYSAKTMESKCKEYRRQFDAGYRLKEVKVEIMSVPRSTKQGVRYIQYHALKAEFVRPPWDSGPSGITVAIGRARGQNQWYIIPIPN